MKKRISAAQAAEYVKDGMVIMIGGFMSNGAPDILIDALVEKKVKNLTVIANDTGMADKEGVGTGIAKLQLAGAISNLIASHIGLNPYTGKLMTENKLHVELCPQGTLAERIRAGGAGLGGVLTPTGIGTEVAQGKQIITVDGKDYLLEKPLVADIAFIRGSIVDENGSVFYKGTTRNFNPMMATAAQKVIVAAEKIVPVGAIEAENIVTPGILVDYIVEGEPKYE